MRSTLRWAAVMLAAGGCNRDHSAPGDEGKKITIGVSIPNLDHAWMTGVNYWANAAMKAHPEVTWNFKIAGTHAAQTQDVKAMLAQGIDGLVILPGEPDKLNDLVKDAHEKRGLFVVNIDRGFAPGVADIHLEGDNKEFGRRSAEFIADRLHGKGEVVILEGLSTNQVNTDRVEAGKAVFAKYPDIHLVFDQNADWNRETAIHVMETALAKLSHIDAVWAGDDDVAMGAIDAIKKVKRDHEMFVFGGAGSKEAVKMIMDGDPLLVGDVTYSPGMIAAGINMAVGAVRSGPRLPGVFKLESSLITKENAAGFYLPDSAY